jgi:hypothetical protein
MKVARQCCKIPNPEVTSMETKPKQHYPSDVSVTQRTSNELVMLIRKLRWMGMEKEAEAASRELALRHTQAADSVLAVPHGTD